MQQSLRMAEPFIIGCPACLQNFRTLFCTLFCSPDQATFTNVTAVQTSPPAPDIALSPLQLKSADSAGKSNVTSVKEVTFFLSEEFKNATFDSCKDVVFGAANTRAMLFIGNAATHAQV